MPNSGVNKTVTIKTKTLTLKTKTETLTLETKTKAKAFATKTKKIHQSVYNMKFTIEKSQGSTQCSPILSQFVMKQHQEAYEDNFTTFKATIVLQLPLHLRHIRIQICRGSERKCVSNFPKVPPPPEAGVRGYYPATFLKFYFCRRFVLTLFGVLFIRRHDYGVKNLKIQLFSADEVISTTEYHI